MRCFTIIGVALKNHPNNSDSNIYEYAKIIEKLIYPYFRIDLEIVWIYIQKGILLQLQKGLKLEEHIVA